MAAPQPTPRTNPSNPHALEAYQIPHLPPGIYYMPSMISPLEESQLLASLPPSRWISLTHRRLQAWPSPLSKTNTLLASALPTWLTEPLLPRFAQLGLFSESPHGSPNHVLVNEYRSGEGIMPHEDGDAYWPCVVTVSLGASVVLDVYGKRARDKLGEGREEGHGDGDGFVNDDVNGQGVAHEAQEDNVDEEETARHPHSKPNLPHWRILQEPRSLLVTTGQMYADTLHGIAEVTVDEDLGPETVANWSLLGAPEAVAQAGGRNVRGTRTSLTYRDVLKTSNAGARLLGLGRGRG